MNEIRTVPHSNPLPEGEGEENGSWRDGYRLPAGGSVIRQAKMLRKSISVAGDEEDRPTQGGRVPFNKTDSIGLILGKDG